MKKFGKKIVSIILVLTMAVPMTVVAIPNTQALTVTDALTTIGKKAFEVGLKYACASAIEQAELAGNEKESIILKSFVELVLNDSTTNKLNGIEDLCHQILAEIAELRADVKEYTNAISSAIDKANLGNAKKLFADQWKSDVTNVINPQSANEVSVEGALNAYMKYYMATVLSESGVPTDATELAQLKAYWKEKFDEEFDESKCTKSAVLAYKQALEDEFLKIQTVKAINDINRESAKEEVYNSSFVYLQLTRVIDKLVDNYINDGYTVADCAATYAYYALPFSFQQRDFIESVIKEQVMTVTMMEMCLNEYLAFQGTYLNNHKNDGWNNEKNLRYVDNSDNVTNMSYSECVLSYKNLVWRDLSEATKLMESKFRINTTAFTGEQDDVVVTLDDFMKAEDTQRVKLTITGYETDHYYYEDYKGTDADDSTNTVSWWWVKNPHQKARLVKKDLYFYRIMAGDESGKVYYILDPNQFSDTSDLKWLATQVRRLPNAGYDSYIGDLYPVSVDYINLNKPMSDGVNNFVLPSANKISEELKPILNVPYFSAFCQHDMKEFFGAFLPDSSKTPYFITSTYNNNFNSGLKISVKEAEMDLVNINTKVENTNEITTEKININQYPEDTAFFTMILVGESNTFKQKATLTANDELGVLSKPYISHADGAAPAGQSTVAKSGDKVKIHFDIKDVTNFESLKLVRKNAETTETTLISGYEELMIFADAKGGFTFETTMPYSESEFVITTKEPETFASVKISDEADMIGTVEIVDNVTLDKITSVGKNIPVKPGEKITFKVYFKHPSAFKSLVAITNGEEKLLMDENLYKMQFDSHSLFQLITVTMPEGTTEFKFTSKDVNLNRAYAKTDDPAGVIGSVNIYGEFTSTWTNSFERFVAGEELTIDFTVKNIRKFDSVVAVNRDTREFETLVTADQLSTLAKNGDEYTFKTTMPDFDVDYIVVSKSDEEFVPKMLNVDENGNIVISTYEDLRSMSHYVNTGIEAYTKANYVLANDIDLLDRGIEPIGANNENSAVFAGTFDGQGHTLSNIRILSSHQNGYASLFARVSGEIKNLNLNGNLTLCNDGVYDSAKGCSLASLLQDGAHVSNIRTNLNYINDGFDRINHIGGIAYQAPRNVVIENCIVNDTVNLPDSNANYSGIVHNTAYKEHVYIRNCANTSKVNLGTSKEAAGIVYGATGNICHIENCFTACEFAGDNFAPFVGSPYASPDVANSYYLDTCIGENSDYKDLSIAKTMDEFKSGQVLNLLNNGGEIWKQNKDEIFPHF